MERIEKLKLFEERGYTCNLETGKIYNKSNKEMSYKGYDGYIIIQFPLNKKQIVLKGHHFIWWMRHKYVPEKGMQIDHINGIRDDNRISNLRIVTHQENQWNQTKAKGCSKVGDKWLAQISVDKKHFRLGVFDREEDAISAYQRAKDLRKRRLPIVNNFI